MSVYSQSFVCQQINTDAGFRSWGKFISDSLESGGIVKHTDTGQIDWTTVGKPTAGTNIIMGYEIRKTTDAKTTVYIKIEYGSGYNANCPGWKITVGTGTNGSGTLTGAGTTIAPYTAMGAAAGRSQMTVVSVTTSRFLVACFEPGEESPNYSGGLAFQRTCDADGTDNSTGYGVVAWSYSGYVVHQYAEFTGGYGTYLSDGLQILRVARSIRASQGTSVVLPAFWSGINSMPIMRDFLVVPNQMGGHLGQVSTINHMGSNRNYMCVYGPLTNANCWGYTTPETFSMLVRCE